MGAQIFIVAAVLCMYGLRQLEPLIPAAQNAALGLALVGVQIVFVALLALLLNRIGLRRLARPGKEQGQLGGFYRRLGLLLHIVLLLLFAGDIYLAGWAELATMLSGAVPILADELLILLPLLLSWLIVQAILYGLDRAVRLQARQDAQSRQIWSRKRYLLFHIQAGLVPVLIPLGLLMAIIDLLDLIGPHLPPGSLGDALTWAILILGIGLTVLCAPVLIRFTWSCTALNQQPIRKRLEDLCRANGLRYRNILVWRTDKMITNAAVMGFWGPLRYLLLTDALLEEMSPDELAAVFAHELGHISGRHIPYYGLFIVGLNLVIHDCLELLIGRLLLLPDGPAI
ncbi:MAG: M48 family metalloprotease, partial [Phycisphaerae bacterium]|nr:M48 family metalloprotease [Phycisphaerae bacterium]